MGADDVNVHLFDAFDLQDPYVVTWIKDLAGYVLVLNLVIEVVLTCQQRMRSRSTFGTLRAHQVQLQFHTPAHPHLALQLCGLRGV